VVHQGDQARRLAFTVAEGLRSYGFTVVQHCGGGSFKSQMKKADGSGAHVALVIGDDEAAAHEVSIKPLRAERGQWRIGVEQLPEAITDLLYGEEGE